MHIYGVRTLFAVKGKSRITIEGNKIIPEIEFWMLYVRRQAFP